MRCYMISTLSSAASRRAAYHRHCNGGYVFSGSSTTVSSRDAPLQDGGCTFRWLMNMLNHGCFMSTQTNPPHNSSSYNESTLKGEGRDDITIKVVSREHIKPSSPTPQNLRYYKFSIIDQAQMSIYFPLMFFYQNLNYKDNENVEEMILNQSNHLKQSLSETLTRMYPFAGKIASELHIDCNDDGVYYIETRVDDQLKNVLKKPNNKFLRRLIPVVDAVPNLPLLGSYVTMVQVNFFMCGGVSITMQHNHKLADGQTNMTFLNTWAGIARRDPNQIYPNFVSHIMLQNSLLPFAPYIPLWYLYISPAYLKAGKCATKRFVFNASALKEPKAKASKNQPVTRVVAVLALLWKCVTIETQYKSSVLDIPVDIQSRCSPPLPKSSVGNVVSGASARFDRDASNLELASMAVQLKNAIADVKGESFEELKGQNEHVRFVEHVKNSRETFSDHKAEYYWTPSFCNSGTKDVDFGWGKPVWSCIGNVNEDVPLFINRIVVMDSCSGNGIDVWVTLEKQVMDAVKCNPELLSYASVDPSPL